jgi:hypothetical protein
MKKTNQKIRRFQTLLAMRWTKTSLLAFLLIVGLAVTSCRTIYVPVESGTTVNVKDSTVFHYVDSVRIHEATRYKDMAWLGDTLKIDGKRSKAWAYADTSKEVLIGGLEEDEYKEKTKIVYKDRWHVRDSLVYVEKPVPVEITKEKKVFPKWMILLSFLGVISSMILLFLGFLKMKNHVKLP